MPKRNKNVIRKPRVCKSHTGHITKSLLRARTSNNRVMQTSRKYRESIILATTYRCVRGTSGGIDFANFNKAVKFVRVHCAFTSFYDRLIAILLLFSVLHFICRVRDSKYVYRFSTSFANDNVFLPFTDFQYSLADGIHDKKC